jgi:hypothetical protein
MSFYWLKDTFRLLTQGISFCFLRAPKSSIPISGFSSFCFLAIIFTATFTVISYFKAGADSFFFENSYGAIAVLLLVLLISSALAATLIQRKVLWLSLASLALVCINMWTILLSIWTYKLNVFEIPSSIPARIIFGIILLCLLRIYAHLMQPRKAWRIILAALFTLSLCYRPWQQNLYQPIFMSTYGDEEFAEEQASWNYNVESVFSAQADILQKQLSTLSTQKADKIDLYAIGVAGDGSERVFRNEAEYLQQFLPKQLKAHYLPLINSEEGNPGIAIASFTNLKTAVFGVAQKMDPAQDILMVYLTSHGSKNHEFLLQLGNLPLTQITPEQLNQVLNESGIKHQIIIISACYSGGYIEPLQNDNRLIITAARKDRTSFGCGAESDITWFGNAFWVMAMNKTRNFEEAFSLANKTISFWEKKEKEIPSLPQMSVGKEMHQHLSRWQTQLPKKLDAIVFKPTQSPSKIKAQPAAIDTSAHR